MTSVLTPEQQALQKKMIELVSGNLGKGATSYPGATTSSVDPLQLMAANIMMNYGSGHGYTAPSMLGSNFWGTSGGGGSTGSSGLKEWGSEDTVSGSPTTGSDEERRRKKREDRKAGGREGGKEGGKQSWANFSPWSY